MAAASSMIRERQKSLLNYIVDRYVMTAAPVGSSNLLRSYHLGVSPATVRNQMAELEEQGYIVRPHTSAGAVPTDKAYRLYVENLPEPTELPSRTRTLIQQRFRLVERDLDTWTRLSAAILSQLVRNVAIISILRTDQSRVNQLQLVHLQEDLVLLVLVLQGARLRQHLIPVTEPVNQEDLTILANKLNSYISGKKASELTHELTEETPPLEQRVLNETVQLLETTDSEFDDPYVQGLRHILGQPEFAGGSRALQAVEALEDRQVVRDLLAEAPEYGSVKVIIGEENRHDSLHPFSVIVCQYGVPGKATGIVSALGPTRMNYSSAIAEVRYISRFMSDLISSLHAHS
jgi:heat-inducible transcriptional repressor